MEKARRDHLRTVIGQARQLVQDSLERQLASYGFFSDRHPESPDLGREEAQRRTALLGAFSREARAVGVNVGPEAVQRFVREAGGTWINRLAALRAMEARGMLEPAAARVSDDYGGLSLRALRLQDRALEAGQRPSREEALRAGIADACRELSAGVRILFDLDDEASILWPELRHLLALFSDEGRGVTTADWSEPDILGWVYQYYNTEANAELKRRKNRTKRFKYAPDDIPIANQFYSPHWVVRVLVDNTLGRIWLESHGRSPALVGKPDAWTLDERRRDIPHPLREAEAFRAWIGEEPDPVRDRIVDRLCRHLVPLPSVAPERGPMRARDVRVLDPACGSGHFLLYAFDVLFTMYREDEPELDPRAIPALILGKNLFGIDIDLRAAQLAAWSLYLKARSTLAAIDPQAKLEISALNIVVADAHLGDDPRKTRFLARFREEPELQELYRTVLEGLDHTNVLGSLLKVRGEFEKLFGKVDEARASKAGKKREALEAAGQRPLLTVGPLPPRKTFTTAGTNRSFSLDEVLAELRDFEQATAAVGQDIGARLFSTDLARAVGVLGLLSQQYDVVLMNPPYGEMPEGAHDYAKGYTKKNGNTKEKIPARYPKTHDDYATAFIDQGLDLLHPNGLLGCLVPRSFMYLGTFAPMRSELLTKAARPELVHEYGLGILDGATVRTAGAVLRKRGRGPWPEQHPITFQRLSYYTTDEKLRLFVKALPTFSVEGPDANDETYVASIASLANVPGSPYAYWASDSLRALFTRFPPLDRDKKGVLTPGRPDVKIADTKQGVATADDSQFLRHWWEISPDKIGEGKRWVPFVKGGRSVRFYSRIDLLVNWENGGEEMKELERQRRAAGHPSRGNSALTDWRWFREGATWPPASWRIRRFGFMPAGCIFAHKGCCIFPVRETAHAIVGTVNSAVATIALLMQTPERMWEIGTVGAIPMPQPLGSKVGALAARLQTLVREAEHEGAETCRDFVEPDLRRLHRTQPGFPLVLDELLRRWFERRREAGAEEGNLLRELDDVVADLYGLSSDDRALIARELGRRPKGESGYAQGEGADDGDGNPGEEELAGDEAAADADGDEGANTEPTTVAGPERDLVACWISLYVKQVIDADDDGIVPLIASRGERSLLARVRETMAKDLGDDAARALETQAPAYLGTSDLAAWLETKFFPWHVELYKNRPLFWLLSSEGFERRASRLTFRAFVHARKIGPGVLPRLVSFYLEPILERAAAEVAEAEVALGAASRADKRTAERALREWASSVEALRAFRATIDEVVRGPEKKEIVAANAKWLPHMIAEVRGGRDTGYGFRPDVDYGVRVNIRPLVEKKLLPRAVLSRLG
jgi:hypothetical protein